MTEAPKPIPLRFWKSTTGREPVREWLNELPREDQRIVGRDIAKVQFGWPVGLPVCRPLGGGLWEASVGWVDPGLDPGDTHHQVCDGYRP